MVTVEEYLARRPDTDRPGELVEIDQPTDVIQTGDFALHEISVDKYALQIFDGPQVPPYELAPRQTERFNVSDRHMRMA
jgi:hypothetical protein